MDIIKTNKILNFEFSQTHPNPYKRQHPARQPNKTETTYIVDPQNQSKNANPGTGQRMRSAPAHATNPKEILARIINKWVITTPKINASRNVLDAI